MISDPRSVHYACVAKGTTVLAEFNSKDVDLGGLAVKCLEHTPPFHATFSHTVRGRTYTFLIDNPFVYFAIHEDRLETCDGLAFLKSIKIAFDGLFERISGRKRLETLKSHCFQGEFNPVFHQLLTPSLEMEDGPTSPRMVSKLSHGRCGSLDSQRSVPLLGDAPSNLTKKKKKKRFFEEIVCVRKDVMSEKKVDVSEEGPPLSRVMHKNGLFSGELGQQKAKKAWKKQVWVVLSLDLIICTVLFAVWLWVCRGFKCIDG